MTGLVDANVLITGGAGSFGRAFAAHALTAGARRVVVYSRDEAKHAALTTTLHRDPRLRCFVGDVRDRDRLHWAMRGIDYVVHAAALKRVDACEADPYEAIQTNIVGSQNVALAAIAAGVQRAVLLSTDKAAAPCTLYGSTKAVAERAWIQFNGYADGTHTRLAATRYGNVLGSTGSVIPHWIPLIQQGRPLTISHPDATRFWMLMENAVALVQMALDHMEGGETFVPKIPASSLLQLLSVLTVALTGAQHTAYTVTGLVAGEKAHETLIGADELSRVYHDPLLHRYIIYPAHRTWPMRPLQGVRVRSTFSYQSNDAARQLSAHALHQVLVTAGILPPTPSHADAPL